MTALTVVHLHFLVREIEPTEQVWMTAIDWLTCTGKLSNDKREEFVLASDVIGVTMLADCIKRRLSSEATPTAVTTPFHSHDSPNLPDGADIAKGAPGEVCYVSGSVRSVAGKQIAGATLDVSQVDGDEHYEAQHGGDQPWMRGIFTSNENGHFVIQTVLPVPYSIPMNGGVGDIMAHTNISPMRRPHIHFLINAPGYHQVITNVFKESCPHKASDVVYAVKQPLIAEFRRAPTGSATPIGTVSRETFGLFEYDFVLQPVSEAAIAQAEMI